MSRDLATKPTPRAAAAETTSRTARLPWCCTASVQEDNGGDGQVKIHHPDPFVEMSEWMKGIEESEGRGSDAVGAGVYDTWRCDRIVEQRVVEQTPLRAYDDTKPIALGRPSGKEPGQWKQWGAEFHLNRLSNSYQQSLLLFSSENADQSTEDTHDLTSDSPSTTGAIQKSLVDRALRHSRRVADELLREADSALALLEDAQVPTKDSGEHDVLFQLVRVTILWSTPRPMNSSSHTGHSSPLPPIVVRGHATYIGPTQSIRQPSSPIAVSIAVDSESSPSRASRHAHLKVAKWTHLRQHVSRPPGVSEALLTRWSDNGEGRRRLQILEGLSSNVFVVYDDDTIRTASEGVLHGYVRHLVLESALECGLTHDPAPVWLLSPEECRRHWKEVFITSSSRLIYPVSEILYPSAVDTDRSSKESGGASEYRVYWTSPAPLAPSTNASASASRNPQKWQLLLWEILRKGGYALL